MSLVIRIANVGTLTIKAKKYFDGWNFIPEKENQLSCNKIQYLSVKLSP